MSDSKPREYWLNRNRMGAIHCVEKSDYDALAADLKRIDEQLMHRVNQVEDLEDERDALAGRLNRMSKECISLFLHEHRIAELEKTSARYRAALERAQALLLAWSPAAAERIISEALKEST
jgi:hypothetical protein